MPNISNMCSSGARISRTVRGSEAKGSRARVADFSDVGVDRLLVCLEVFAVLYMEYSKIKIFLTT